MALPPKTVVPVIGWYQPHDNSTDWTGETVNPLTGELEKEPSMTKQSFAAECDINNIIRSYSVSGIITHINEKAAIGTYADLPDPIDYQESLNLVMAAEASFASLPSSVRNRFSNDPEQFLAFMGDPANQDEMIALGLAKDTRPPKTEPAPPGVGEPPAPPAAEPPKS